MTQFKNPSPFCSVCGLHRSVTDHSECSKQLKKNTLSRKTKKPADYSVSDPSDYWESNDPWLPTQEDDRGDYDRDIQRQRELDDADWN